MTVIPLWEWFSKKCLPMDQQRRGKGFRLRSNKRPDHRESVNDLASWHHGKNHFERCHRIYKREKAIWICPQLLPRPRPRPRPAKATTNTIALVSLICSQEIDGSGHPRKPPAARSPRNIRNNTKVYRDCRRNSSRFGWNTEKVGRWQSTMEKNAFCSSDPTRPVLSRRLSSHRVRCSINPMTMTMATAMATLRRTTQYCVANHNIPTNDSK